MHKCVTGLYELCCCALSLLLMIHAQDELQPSLTSGDVSNSSRGPTPPVITEEPQTETVYVAGRDQVMLPCRASGEPTPTFFWTRSGGRFNYARFESTVSSTPGVGDLVFNNSQANIEARYQCHAVNDLGTAVSQRVLVREAYLDAFPERAKNNYMVQLGRPLSLLCVTPRSYPPAQITWVRHKARLPAERVVPTNRITYDPDGNLHFAGVVAADAADEGFGEYYECEARNDVLRSFVRGCQASVSVQLGDETPITSTPSLVYASAAQQVALQGEAWQVFCIFSGHPTPRIRWTRLDAAMPKNAKVLDYGTKLVLDPVDVEDEGAYQCAADSDDNHESVRKSFNLEVHARPSWKSKPDSVYASENQPVEITCEVEGTPTPNIFWYIDGVPISKVEPNPRRIVEKTKIHWKRVSPSDTAVVQCNGTNKYGNIFANAYLVVRNIPAVIEVKPEAQVAVKGQSTNLTCQAFGSPQPDVVWQKDEQVLEGERYVIAPEGHLMIQAVQFNDSGVYTCLVSNIYGNDSATASLNIAGGTEIVSGPVDQTVRSGSDVTLTCEAITDPRYKDDLKINWFKDDKPLTQIPGWPNRIVRERGSLKIKSVIVPDSGVYKCEAKNELDSDAQSAVLTVQAPPSSPENVRVECLSDDHKAVVFWDPGRSNNAEILSYIVQYNTLFEPDVWVNVGQGYIPGNTPWTYVTVKLSSYGTYSFRVVARNIQGYSVPSMASRTCSIPPGLPDKNPEKVIGEGDDPDNLIIYWTTMPEFEHNGPGFEYHVKWRQLDSNDYTVQVVVDWSVWYYVVSLQGVPPYTAYEVQVSCVNNLGASLAPPTVAIGHSGEAAPVVFPTNVRVDLSEIGSHTAVVAWKPPGGAGNRRKRAADDEDLKGFFLGYRVEYGVKDSWPNDVQTEDFIVNEREFCPPKRDTRRRRRKREIIQDADEKFVVRLEHLPPDSDIILQVRILTKYHEGPPSKTVEFRTEPGPAGKPVPPAVDWKCPRADLTWSFPRNRSNLSAVEAEVKCISLGSVSARTIAHLQDCTVITGDIVINNLTFTGYDDVPGLEPSDLDVFKSVKSIEGSLEIIDTGEELTTLDMFKNLETVEGATSNTSRFSITNTRLTHVELPALTTVDQSRIQIQKNQDLARVDLPSLETITESQVEVNGNKNLCVTMETSWLGAASTDLVSVSANGDKEVCYAAGVGCDAECSGSCDGPSPSECDECQHVKDDGACVTECSAMWHIIIKGECSNVVLISLIAGLLIVVIAVVVIIACCQRRKQKSKGEYNATEEEMKNMVA